MQPGTRGNPNAQILIVGEAWGAEEDRLQQPFVGESGKELDRMLRDAGISPDACYYTNVVNARPPSNNMTKFFVPTADAKALGLQPIRGLYPDTIVLEGIRKLEQLIAKLQPKVIVGFGNYALWAMTENSFSVANGKQDTAGHKIPTGIGNYRGSHLRSRFLDASGKGIPFLPTYHPAAIMRQWPWRAQAVHDLRARVPKALAGEWDDFERNFIIRPTFEQVMETLNTILLRAELSPNPILVANDIETAQGHLECVGLAWSVKDALCIPIMCSDKWEGYWSALEEQEILLALKRLMEHPNIHTVGQNFLYDYQYYYSFYNIRTNYKHDTMLAHHVCYPGTPMGLDTLSSMYCSYHVFWKEDGKEASKNHNDEQRWVYNCRDAVVTYEAIEAIWSVLRYYGLEMQYAMQMNRANNAIQMMLRGTRLDEKRRGEERILQMETLQEIAVHLDAMMPESVANAAAATMKSSKTPWYRSPRQLMSLFYDVLGIAAIRDTKTFEPTVNDEALTRIGIREPLTRPIIEALQQYRSVETFGQFINMKVGKDKRVHTTYSPTAETFRYRSGPDAFGSGRNLQNLPKGAEDE